MNLARTGVLLFAITINLFGCGGEQPEVETNKASFSAEGIDSFTKLASEPLPELSDKTKLSGVATPDEQCKRCVICDANGRHCGKPVCCEDVAASTNVGEVTATRDATALKSVSPSDRCGRHLVCDYNSRLGGISTQRPDPQHCWWVSDC